MDKEPRLILMIKLSISIQISKGVEGKRVLKNMHLCFLSNRLKLFNLKFLHHFPRLLEANKSLKLFNKTKTLYFSQVIEKYALSFYSIIKWQQLIEKEIIHEHVIYPCLIDCVIWAKAKISLRV